MRRIEGLKRSFHRDLRRLEEILERKFGLRPRPTGRRKPPPTPPEPRLCGSTPELVRMLLAEKDDDGTPVYIRAEAQTTASFMQEYGVRTVEELDKAEDAERVQEADLEAVAQTSRPALLAGGRKGYPACPTGEGPELGSFRSGKEDSVNEPDPRDREPK